MARDGRRSIRCLVFGASLRRDALNDRLASLAANVVEEQGATVDRASMADFECPSYDLDVEQSTGLPEPALAFCRRIKEADAFIIASPEYNASMPGFLKNSIDWVSRARPQPIQRKAGAAHVRVAVDGGWQPRTLVAALKKQWVEFLGERPDATIDRVEVSSAETA
jgi:NAD(P)H-dependent FMN reductase